MTIPLSESEILFTARLLNFQSDYIPNAEGWIKGRCLWPHHRDDSPSFGINLKSGCANCFVCGSTNIIKVYQELNNISSYEEALKQIKETSPFVEMGFPKKKVDYSIKKNKTKVKIELEGETMSLDPTKYDYLIKRGFTKEFVNKYNIVHCLSGIYGDYFIIPITDSKKELYLFEARKLLLRETMQKILGRIREDISLDEQFEQFKKDNGITFSQYKIKYANEESRIKYQYKEYLLKYIASKKVLYPSGANVKSTLWNIDELDRSKELYVCEGIGGIPKLQRCKGTNVTCVFGSKITEEQKEYLREFKQIIVIPDNDPAGLTMVEELSDLNILVLPVSVEDTVEQYEEELRNLEPIAANEYIVRKKL